MSLSRPAVALALACTLLSGALATPVQALAISPNGSAGMSAGARGTAPSEGVQVWLVRSALVSLLKWARGQAANEAVNYTLDRSGVRNHLWSAADHLLGLGNDRSLPAGDRAEYRRLEREFRQYARVLDQLEKSDHQIRAELRSLRGDFERHLRRTEARLAQLDARLARLEREQGRQLRRIEELEGRMGALEGRVDETEEDIRVIKGIVDPDPDRFLRHDTYVSGALLYANSPSLGGDASIGGEVTGQYNFNQFFGIMGGLALIQLAASDVEGMPDGSAVSWDNLSGHVGALTNLVPPRNPVSLQLGVGGGIAQNRLVYFAPGVDRTKRELGEELGSLSNVYMLLKADLGVAPPAFDFEPVASFGLVTFLDEVAYEDESVQSNVGSSVWYVTLGVRFRQYLRGGLTKR